MSYLHPDSKRMDERLQRLSNERSKEMNDLLRRVTYLERRMKAIESILAGRVNEDELLSNDEAATILDVSPRKITELINKGQLTRVRRREGIKLSEIRKIQEEWETF